MRWVRLTAEESRVCHAPRKIDPIGALALCRWGQWRKESLFVILSAFFDESGMGQEEHLTIGGFVFKLAQLHKFNQRWAALLKRNRIPYAHFTEMIAHAPPYFEDWSTDDVYAFYNQGLKIAQKHAVMGVSVTVNKADFRRHYKSRFDKTGGDSVFGLCARVVIQYLTGYFDKDAGVREPRLSMIFDKNDQYGNAAKDIFYDVKRLYSDGGRILDDFGFGESRDVGGLQMADFLAAFARQSEPELLQEHQQRKLRMDLVEKPGPRPKAGERTRAPLMHVPVGEEAFDLFVDEQVTGLPLLRSRQRWIARQLKKANP